MRGLDEVLTAEILHRAGLADAKPSELTGEQWEVLRTTIAGLAQRFLSPERGYLYRLPALNYTCPFRLKRVAEEPEKFKTLSLAVWAGMRERRTSASAADESQQLTAAVSRMLKRLQRRMANIEKDIAEASDFERYRQMGELLKINRHRLTKGMDAITVENVFVEPPRDIRIPLDPALSPEDNIERCFQRYRKGRDGLALLQRRLEITRAELEQWRAIERALQEDFDTAAERYRSELASVLPKTAERKTEQPRLPYREFTLSTGVRVLVGRDGSDNDRTTFEFAKPYELWFHTQQCPGSHVVMKFPNKAFTPSRTEIAEAAAIAAWHSKARRDSLVPVIYTQRKYVRKPRKAKPGLVTVEREKSVMVAPQKPSTEPG
ncbi:MAG: DUF814 domain-containing protein [Candidatus Zixiibacteriota bacterium]|nr:MAG: DUF814 domain-containing protein [candidate division Zixibacteria bacterium]